MWLRSGSSATSFSIACLETERLPKWWTVQAWGWVDAKASSHTYQQESYITLPVPDEVYAVTPSSARWPCEPYTGGAWGLGEDEFSFLEPLSTSSIKQILIPDVAITNSEQNNLATPWAMKQQEPKFRITVPIWVHKLSGRHITMLHFCMRRWTKYLMCQHEEQVL